MMPLILASEGDENIIRKIGGSPEVKKHLENLGFVVGGNVKVVSHVWHVRKPLRHCPHAPG